MEIYNTSRLVFIYIHFKALQGAASPSFFTLMAPNLV